MAETAEMRTTLTTERVDLPVVIIVELCIVAKKFKQNYVVHMKDTFIYTVGSHSICFAFLDHVPIYALL